MRPNTFVIIALLVIVSLGYWGWRRVNYGVNENFTIPTTLTSNYKIIGVIAMSNSNAPSKSDIENGDAIYLVVSRNSPYYSKVMSITQQIEKVVTENTRFELALADENHDQIVDSEDPIWTSLFAVIFVNSGENYQIKSLPQVGIRAILLKHITPTGNHTVILSDGTERTLFEWGRPLKQIPK